MTVSKKPALRRVRRLFVLLAFAATVQVFLFGFAVSPAHARTPGKKIDFVNFDPNGRLGMLEQEAQVAASQAVSKQQRMDRDMVLQTIMQAAGQEGQDPILVLAVAMAESRFDPYVTSSRGAVGLMQLMPSTARRFGCSNPYDVYQNAACGARYLGWLLERYNGSIQLALAAYNAGPAPVDRLAEVPRIGETQAFVAKVLQYMDELRLELPE